MSSTQTAEAVPESPEALGRPFPDLVKRAMDVVASGLGLLVLSPVLVTVAALIWLEDRHSPFYVANRIGLEGKPFRMVKFRSMVVNADRTGVDSTAKSDSRVTRIGRIIRRLKLDEVSQLWDVLCGRMSLVGPRPNVERDVRLYTAAERGIFGVRPGITDFASVVFADEGEILEGSPDPDLRYNQFIRPWKSRLALHYIACRSVWLDLRLMLATVLNAISRRRALGWITAMLRQTGADPLLIEVAGRRRPLVAAPPPGASQIVDSR